jgi:hypothetical protein
MLRQHYYQATVISMSLTARRSLQALRRAASKDELPEPQILVPQIWNFAHRLQEKYPFTFVKALRDLPNEQNRWIQERLVTHFLFGAIAELSRIDQALIDKAWLLGAQLSRTIGKGGENFRPQEFNEEQKRLAEEIGAKNFQTFLNKAEELSLAVSFKLGPVNSSEHVVVWCFRYVRLLFSSAKWESVSRDPVPSPALDPVVPQLAVSPVN